MKDPEIQKFFDSLARVTPVVSGTVASVGVDSATGRQTAAKVQVASSIVDIKLDTGSPLLAAGNAVRLEQVGPASAAEYRLYDVSGASLPSSGWFQMLDTTTLYGQAYEGGDVIVGGLTAGNQWMEFATGTVHYRAGNDIYAVDTAATTTIDGTEYAAGTKLIGPATRTSSGHYTTTGSYILLTPDALILGNPDGVKIQINADGTASMSGLTIGAGGITGGQVTIDDEGISLTTTSIGNTGSQYEFKIIDGAATMAKLYGYKGGGGIAWNVTMLADGDAMSHQVDLVLAANNGEVKIYADAVTANCDVSTTGAIAGQLRTTNSGAGAPTGGTDGDLYLDTSNERLYVKVNGAWKYAALV